MIFYTGVGSQKTPPSIRSTIVDLARHIARQGLTLRSGAAEGADAMFESGATTELGADAGSEIYIPWPRFNGHDSPLCNQMPEAFAIAERMHPAWHNCSSQARKLHARDVHQVLGEDLCTPSAFVVCWTPGGKIVGGTATAIRVAMDRAIPVHNLATDEGRQWAWATMMSFAS